MCDLNRVSFFLITGKVAYLLTLALLSIAMINSISLYTVAANVPLMAVAIISAGTSTAMYAGARAGIADCLASGGPCMTELQRLQTAVVGLLISLAAFTVALIALAIVAVVPFAGAAAIGSFISLFIGLTALISGGIELQFAQASRSFIDCRSNAGASNISSVLVPLAYLTGLAAAGFSIGGGLTGRIPWLMVMEW